MRAANRLHNVAAEVTRLALSLRRAGALVAVLLFMPAAFAQPKITAISPDWVQRGATLDMTLTGEGLNSVTGFVFSGESGLSATVVIESNPPPSVTIESAFKGIAVAAT